MGLEEAEKECHGFGGFTGRQKLPSPTGHVRRQSESEVAAYVPGAPAPACDKTAPNATHASVRRRRRAPAGGLAS